MLALSSSTFSTFGWPLEEEPISHEQHNNNNNNNNTIFYRETETSDQSFLHYPPLNLSQPLANSSEFKRSNEVFGDATMAKKLNHNASERDRRKKINSLYSSLRSLLPAADQTKKLSIPTTVSHVLKYIPELQSELERLVHKKGELISRINSGQQEDDLLSHIDIEKKRKCAIGSPLSAVSVSPLGDREFVIQICTVKLNNSPLSEILLNLEVDYGLLLLNASCFESFGERVFYNLHLQVQGNQRVEIETVREKLLSLYENSEELFSSVFGPRQM